MGHVTPVIHAVLALRRSGRVVDEAIHAFAGKDTIKIVDGAFRGRVPFGVDGESCVGGEDCQSEGKLKRHDDGGQCCFQSK